MVMLFLVLVACFERAHSHQEVWVGGGWIHRVESAGGQPVGADAEGPRWFLSADQAGPTTVDWDQPMQAGCEPLFHTDLGDVSRHIAMGGSAPDTVMAWAPDGQALAVGSFLGELVVLDGWTGRTLARRQLSETMVKQVLWSGDGQTLYVAEQSPDGNVIALDPQTLGTVWTLKLSDWIETSPLPAGDLYGAYTLPAAYGLDLLPDGSLFVAATHAWNDRTGARRNQSILLNVGPDGDVINQWPDEPLDAVFFRTRITDNLALIPTSKSSPGPAPREAPVGGVLIFDLETFRPRNAVQIDPLEPWFTNSFIWEAVDLDSRGLFLGLADGRAGLWSLDGEALQPFPSSTPILAGEVPIVASIGSGFLHQGWALYQISSTHIPFGAASTELEPPAAHPEANTIVLSDPHGNRAWTWRGPHLIQGLTPSPDGRRVIAGAGERLSDSRRDLFGALVFDLHPTQSDTPQPTFERFCRTRAPIFFRTASTVDGRVAVTEHPARQGDDPAFGSYRVTVFR